MELFGDLVLVERIEDPDLWNLEVEPQTFGNPDNELQERGAGKNHEAFLSFERTFVLFSFETSSVNIISPLVPTWRISKGNRGPQSRVGARSDRAAGGGRGGRP
jgi:hypothetical protein